MVVRRNYIKLKGDWMTQLQLKIKQRREKESGGHRQLTGGRRLSNRSPAATPLNWHSSWSHIQKNTLDALDFAIVGAKIAYHDDFNILEFRNSKYYRFWGTKESIWYFFLFCMDIKHWLEISKQQGTVKCEGEYLQRNLTDRGGHFFPYWMTSLKI